MAGSAGPSALDLEHVSARYFAAWQARDPDAIAALHTEDTQFWSHLGTEPVHGREAVRATFAALFQQFPNLGLTVYRVLFGASHWVLDWKLTFDGLDGKPRGFDCLDVVEVSPDGLVARKDTFIDSVQKQEQTQCFPAWRVASAAPGDPPVTPTPGETG